MSNIHCIDTKCNKKKKRRKEKKKKRNKTTNLQQMNNGVGMDYLDTPFQSVLLNDISNAPNLCKYSEHRSEEVMVG